MAHPPSGVEPAGVEATSAGLKLPRTAPSDAIEAVIRAVGHAISWLWLVLVLLILANVILRYVWGQSSIPLEELQWHAYGIGMIIGISYCIQLDGHVRIDVLAEHLSQRRRAWIEFWGLILLMLPFVVIAAIEAIPFVQFAYRTGEVSIAPGGLTHRWIIKSFLVLGFVFMALAGLARLLRVCALLFGLPRPRD